MKGVRNMITTIAYGMPESPVTQYLFLKNENEEKHGKKHDTCDTAYHSFFESLNCEADH